MSWRVGVLTLVLLLVGVGGGYAAGQLLDQPRADSGSPVPVTAQAPSTTATPLSIVADPDTAPLAPDLPTHPVDLPNRLHPLSLQVPDGWLRGRPFEDQPSWNWVLAANPNYTYLLRVTITAQNRQPILILKRVRLFLLDGATSQLTIQSQSEDSFAATYVDVIDETTMGHRRQTYEQWVQLGPDPNIGYAAVSVTGRYEDRAGLRSLLASTVESLSVPS